MYGPFASSVSSSSSFIDVPATIRELTQDLSMAFNTGNYDHGAAQFAPDGFFMPSQHEAAQGPRTIERILRQLGDAGYQDLRLQTVRVEHSGDMAVEVGRYTVAVRQANGTVIAQRGDYLHTWRRIGTWLITAACWNSNLPLV